MDKTEIVKCDKCGIQYEDIDSVRRVKHSLEQCDEAPCTILGCGGQLQVITVDKPMVMHCSNCLYIGTHENCDGCLGTPEEVKMRENLGFEGYNSFLYKRWAPGDGIARLLQFEREGKRNIVIGGQGEAEVNINDSPEVSLIKLCGVAEDCGYLVTKGEWTPMIKEIHVFSHGHFVLRYSPLGLRSIMAIHEQVLWDAEGRTHVNVRIS